jgi:hypothetical protein
MDANTPASNTANSRTKTRKNLRIILGVLGVLVVIGIPIGLWLKHKRDVKVATENLHPAAVQDPLCKYAAGLQMHCVAILADESELAPGSMVEFPKKPEADAKVPLRRGDLLSESCTVPGAETPHLVISGESNETLPSFDYKFSNQLQADAELDIPQLKDFKLKGGPNAGNLAKVVIDPGEGHSRYIDEPSFRHAYSSCSIKQSCVDAIRDEDYRVVSRQLIASSLKYTFVDSSNGKLDFESSIKNKVIATSNSSLAESQEQNGALQAKHPVVLAVEFFPDDIIRRQQFCQQPEVISQSGSTTLDVSGTSFAAQQQKKPLGDTASLSLQGGESSECNGGDERRYSGAGGTASVTAFGTDGLTFSQDVRANGGHYVTRGFACTGRTSHDTTATLTSNLNGQITILKRTDNAANLHVSFTDLPAEAVVEVRSPSGPISPSEPPADQPRPVSGELVYPVKGSGVFLVTISLTKTLSHSGGQGDLAFKSAAQIRASLKP